MLTVACVLKSGGDFDSEYVHRLEGMVRDHLNSVPFRFLCLSDAPVNTIQRPLMFNFPGWWSKMELFTLRPPVLALDLDTILVGSIDPLVNAILEDKSTVFMLRSFRKPEYGSGVMGWNRDLSWMIKRFARIASESTFFDRSNALRMKTPHHGVFRGDQNWIQEELNRANYQISSVQDFQPGVISFKNHISKNGYKLPEGATIICFHGKPRPKDVADKITWMRRIWLRKNLRS